MFDLAAILVKLSRERPIFHSEADLQHALAWAIHLAYPDAKIRLEKRVDADRPMYIDLWVEVDSQVDAVELKYFTRQLAAEHEGEVFRLKSHAADDLVAYSFVADIVRLEKIIQLYPSARCWAVLITNDPIMWKEPRSTRPCNKDAFRLHQGAILSGTLAFRKSYEDAWIPLTLAGTYSCAWQPYSNPGSEFKILLLQL